jgi:hypothetical protein
MHRFLRGPERLSRWTNFGRKLPAERCLLALPSVLLLAKFLLHSNVTTGAWVFGWFLFL